MCSVYMCFNVGFIASGWVWHCGPILHLWGPQPGHDDRWACPPSGVTYDPAWCLGGRGMRSKVRPWQLMRQTVTIGPEERQWCEVGVVVRRCCCSYTGNEVSFCVGGVVEQSCVCCESCVVVVGLPCGLLVDFRWPVNTWLRTGVLEAQGGVVWMWFGPSFPA